MEAIREFTDQELKDGYEAYLAKQRNAHPWQQLLFTRTFKAEDLTYDEFVAHVKRYPSFYEEWCR